MFGQATGAPMAVPHWLQCLAEASFSVPQLLHFTALTVAPVASEVVVAGGSSSSSLTAVLNSLMPLPSDPPRSASLVAPNSITRTRRIMTSSIGPSPNGPAAAIGSTSCTLFTTSDDSIGILDRQRNNKLASRRIQG